MTKAEDIPDVMPEPKRLHVWAIRYALEILDGPDRSVYGPDQAIVCATDDLEDALQIIRDAWDGKILQSDGCTNPDCHCGGKPHRARVMGVKFQGAKIMAQLTDLEGDVKRATTVETDETKKVE